MTGTDGFTKSVPDEGSYESTSAPWPAELRVFKEVGRLEIDFSDGFSCSLPAEYLRVESPSAEVQGHGPSQKKIVSGRRHVKIAAVVLQVRTPLFVERGIDFVQPFTVLRAQLGRIHRLARLLGQLRRLRIGRRGFTDRYRQIAHQLWHEENPEVHDHNHGAVEATDEHKALAERRVRLACFLPKLAARPMSKCRIPNSPKPC